MIGWIQQVLSTVSEKFGAWAGRFADANPRTAALVVMVVFLAFTADNIHQRSVDGISEESLRRVVSEELAPICEEVVEVRVRLDLIDDRVCALEATVAQTNAHNRSQE